MASLQPDNDRFLKACRREAVDRVPVWMMRQAGRYLPEYRAVRARADFWTMVRTPELAAEVTVQPVDILGVDAAILFSDILVVPDAMGVTVTFEEGEGPRLASPIAGPADLPRLRKLNAASDLGYVGGAIRATLEKLAGRVPLIGFSGAPFTLACYLVDGRGGKDFPKTRAWMHADPASFRALLERLGDAVADYLLFQIQSGVHAVQVFDSWIGLLPAAQYEQLVAPVLTKLHDRVRLAAPEIPLIYFANGAPQLITAAAGTSPTVLATCWRTSPAALRGAAARAGLAVQGNLDPAVLLTDAATVRAATEAMMQAFGAAPGHVANLGHGLTPEVPVANARAFIETVQGFRW